MDKIEKIGLSTEILSAYMDNNLSDVDMEYVANAINGNPELMDLCVMNDMVEESIAAGTWDELPAELTRNDFSMPSLDDLLSSENDKIGLYETLIEDSNIVVSESHEEIISDIPVTTDRSNEVSDTIHTGNKTHLDMENNDILNVGYKANENDNTFNPEIFQGYNPSCAVCSQDIVLRDFGIKIPREQLINFAAQQGWYSPDPNRGGTPKECVGNILDACGIETTRYENACFGDLVRELSAGHRVIVSVDADELWINKEEGMYKHLFGEVKNKISDVFDNALGIEGANHALVVAGLNINPNNPKDIRVVLIDSGSGDYCIEYSWKQFSDALADSNNYIIATKEAAPYQYNYNTNKFEPSGFDSNFIPSMATLPEGLANEFSLPDDFYEQFQYFTPFFNIHNPLHPLGINTLDLSDDGDKDEGIRNNDEDSDDTNVKDDSSENISSDDQDSYDHNNIQEDNDFNDDSQEDNNDSHDDPYESNSEDSSGEY